MINLTDQEKKDRVAELIAKDVDRTPEEDEELDRLQTELNPKVQEPFEKTDKPGV